MIKERKITMVKERKIIMVKERKKKLWVRKEKLGTEIFIFL